MREFGVDPKRTLMIGDTTHDLQLAANAGTDAVAVAYGAHPPEQLGDLHPLTIAHSVRELQDWLARHG
jgi:phosphoglycolate phosphatase